MAFREQLVIGQVGESIVSQFFRARGWFVVPVYEVIQDTGIFSMTERLFWFTGLFAKRYTGHRHHKNTEQLTIAATAI